MTRSSRGAMPLYFIELIARAKSLLGIPPPRPTGGVGKSPGVRSGKSSLNLAQMVPSLFGVKNKDVVEFARDLSVLLGSGVSVTQALDIINDQDLKPSLALVLAEISQELNSGAQLSEAMGKHPAIFTNVFCQMVRAGEKSGNLGEALRDATTLLEKQSAIVGKAAGALIYPMLVLGVSGVVVFVMFTSVLPPLIGLFESMDTDLPLPTKILIGFSRFAGSYFLYVALGAIGFGVAAVIYVRRPKGRMQFHRAMLKVPIIGSLKLQGEMARALGVMASLTPAGLPMSEALELASDGSSNECIRVAFRQVRDGLQEGKGIAGPMAATGIFPLSLVRVMKISEEAGTLDNNLEQLSTVYYNRFDESVQRMVGLVEPLSTIAVALGVGFIAMAVIMPMYSILGSIE